MDANDDQIGGTHYKGTFTQQHWDYAWEHEYDQFQYCITKYVDRHKHKDGLVDLYKAKHHLEKYIEVLSAAAVEETAPYEVNPDRDQTVRADGYSSTSPKGLDSRLKP